MTRVDAFLQRHRGQRGVLGWLVLQLDVYALRAYVRRRLRERGRP